MDRWSTTPLRVACSAAMVAAWCLTGCSTHDGERADTSEAQTSTVPTASDAATDGPQQLVETSDGIPLRPATYQFAVFVKDGVTAPSALVDVPAGFVDGATWYVVSRDGHEYVGLWTVGFVYTDPCHTGKSEYDYPGGSVRDLAHALVVQRSTRASTPKPVTLSGYHGLYLEVTGPPDLSKCRVADLWGDPGSRGIYDDGQVDQVWILNVDGQRIVVNAAYVPDKSSRRDVDKLAAMVESLQFVPADST